VTPTVAPKPVTAIETIFGPLNCAALPEPEFTAPFYPPDQIDYIVPMGRMWDSHVTPTDHIYVIRKSNADNWIRSPAPALLVSVGRFPTDQDDNPDLRIVLAHSCNVFTVYIHTGPLDDEVAAVVGDLGPGQNWYAVPGGGQPVLLEAGQPFALNVRGSFDFSAHDTRVMLSGFQVPAHYEGESWKIFTIDPFERFEPALRDAYESLSLRQDDNPGGRIDYDVPGTLAGNWFLEGTTGYAGGGTGTDYWTSHVAFAYDHIDSSLMVVSIGSTDAREALCPLCRGVFGVKGNGPAYESITAADGVVKYEIVTRMQHLGGPQVMPDGESDVLGVLLAEVVDIDTIRIEMIPGATGSQVTGFTENAVLYNR
jgi:hypothetical protein